MKIMQLRLISAIQIPFNISDTLGIY